MKNSPMIVHIPHSSVAIPRELRKSFLLSEEELSLELLCMTDWYVDELFGGSGHDELIHEVSRLVCDPERFREDERELMWEKGMGAIYTRTSKGKVFREISITEREELLKKYYDTHHKRLEKLVRNKLEAFGTCVIIDAHSFSSIPLPHEMDKATPRPDICIGTDDFHSSEQLVKEVQHFFSQQAELSVAVNTPFSGSIVPSTYYQKEKRVQSIMIELNRSLYMNEITGEKSVNFAATRELVQRFLRKLERVWT